MKRATGIVAIAMLALACRSGASGDERANPSPAAGGTAVPTAPKPQLSWTDQTIDELGITVPILDGAPPSRGAAGGITYLIQEQDGVKLGVWYGAGRDLAAWRGFYATPRTATFGTEESITVCGAPAARQRADVAAGETATGAVRGDDGAIGHIDGTAPAVHSVAIALTRGDTPVLIELAVPADRADDMAGDFDYLASAIRCEP
jgi:hypothetical protein